MENCQASEFCGWENNAARYRARIVNLDGVPVTQASLTSIGYRVYDKFSEVEITSGSQAVSISGSVFNTLQAWDKDEEGFNFRHDLPGASFPDPTTYRVEYLFTPLTGGAFSVLFDLKTQDVISL